LIGKCNLPSAIDEASDLINDYDEAHIIEDDTMETLRDKLSTLEDAIYDLENYLMETYDDEEMRLDHLSDDDTADKHE
jgi:hypothetical protein